MMTSYFLSFLQANRVKTLAICLCMALYLALAIIAVTLHRAIPEISQMPLKMIGVQTIVQKTGEIPGKMVDAIFPHSNAPISTEQFSSLRALPFVEEADMAIYSWYFDRSYFKALLGIHLNDGLFQKILENNVTQGGLKIGDKQVVITDEFSTKHDLKIGNTVQLGEHYFIIRGILQSNLTGNIIPADIYMAYDDALGIVQRSEEMRRIYQFNDDPFGNVVLLRSNPSWQGDKEKEISAVDDKLLVFSEKTFDQEIIEQLGIVSSAGKLLFLVLGIIVCISFGLLTVFNLKSREKEIAILRMLGWSLGDLKKQFLSENLLLLAGSVLAGVMQSAIGVVILGRQKIRLELPWDISARPHFLPEENAIERVILANLPVHLDFVVFASVTIGFVLLFSLVSLVNLNRLRNITPSRFST
jgi:hypothetical protein